MRDTEVNAKDNGQLNESRSGHEVEKVQYIDRAGNLSLRSSRNAAEVRAISYALQLAGWNRMRAAKLLSISYRSLLYKIRQHNITPTVEQS
jgi:DNA-binding NtrC family response regulator